MGTFTRIPCSEGLFLNVISDTRFKTNRISVQFVLPLAEDTVAAYGLLPNILRKRSAAYGDFTAFNRMLDRLYGAYIDYGVDKIGDVQMLYLLGNVIDDRYTFDGEALTARITEVLRDLILDPPLVDGRFDPQEVELEKALQIDNLRAEQNDKRLYASRRAVEILCAGQAHGLSKLGTEEAVAALTPEALTAAWKRMLEQARIEVFFSGCGDPAPVRELLIPALAALDRHPAAGTANTLFAPPLVRIDTVERLPVTQAKLVLHYTTGVLAGAVNTAPVQMMSMLLGGSPMSKLFVHVREEKSLCYYCMSRINNYKGLLTIESGVELHQVEEAREAIEEQLDALRRGDFTEEELRQAQLYLQNAYSTLNDSQSSLENHYLKQVLVQQPQSPEDRIALLQAVTREDIIEAARQVRPASRYLLTGEEGKMKLQTITSERLQESYLCGQHETGLKILLAPMPGFQSVYAQFGAKVGSIDMAFRTDPSADYTEVPAGIAHYLEHKLFESEDGDAFSLFAETGASANAFTSFDRTCYLFSATEKFEESLQALLTFVQHPYFTKETVQKEQGIIGQEIQMYEDDPDWCVFCNLLGALYQEHPVRINIAGTVESISHITADLLYECYHAYYNLNNMILVIAGNFDPEAALRVIEENLLPVKRVTVEPKPFAEPETVCQKQVSQKMSVAAPMFALGYKETPLEGKALLQAQLEYEVILDVLVGESAPFYRTLYNQGLINQTFGYEVFSGRGYLALLFSGESKQPQTVQRALDELLQDAKQRGIAPEDFERSRKAIYGRLLRGLTRVEGVANSLMSSEMSGVSMYDSFDLLSGLTLDGVNARLRASFDPQREALSVIEPLA